MDWNFRNDQPIYSQIIEQIKLAIVSGVFKPGERLVSVRDMAMEAGVNPNTMQRALTELERDGLAQSMGTTGRMVTRNQEIVDQLREKAAKAVVERYLDSMKKLGYTAAEAAKVLEDWSYE